MFFSGEVNSGDCLSRWEQPGLKTETASSGQSAGPTAVGGGYSRAPDVYRTRTAHCDVPLTQTGL